MFLLRPLPELKQQLSDAVETGTKDANALEDKKKHVEETYKKIQEDFQEFVKAHGESAVLPPAAACLRAAPSLPLDVFYLSGVSAPCASVAVISADEAEAKDKK